jgi:hypothetical protein
MKPSINLYKPAKLVYMPDKAVLQIAIAVAKGFAQSADSKCFSDMNNAR